MIVGMTGGIGSGKTTATNYLAKKNITIIDADQLSREVVMPNQPALNKITQHFGSCVLNAKGELNRKQLRKIIFHDDQQRDYLEQLLHPLIRQQIIKRLQQARSVYSILVSPLLLETDQYRLVDYIVVVDIEQKNQLQRTTKRDMISSIEVLNIIDKQMKKKQRLEKADYVITNNSSLPLFLNQLDILHQKLIQVALGAQ